jgi:hypothetical protein
MIKKIGIAVASAALVAVGFVAVDASPAFAANEEISCTVKAKVTLTPALTLTPTVVSTAINGKLKPPCQATGLPPGVTLKGGTITGSSVGTESRTCDVLDYFLFSSIDINVHIVWKTKPANALAPTDITFTNRDGFKLPGIGGSSIVSGTSSGKSIEINGSFVSEFPKIAKKCYGKDNAPAPPNGTGVTKFKIPGTYLTT